MTDAISGELRLRRGTKQGDPLSSLLFNVVLQRAVGGDIRAWKARCPGVNLGAGESHFISHLRSAGDVVLTTTSLHQLQQIVTDFTRSSTKHGSNIHPGKTNIRSNWWSNTKNEIEINGMRVDIFPVPYLGQTTTLKDPEAIEVASTAYGQRSHQTVKS